jgi:hypothetical protein
MVEPHLGSSAARCDNSIPSWDRFLGQGSGRLYLRQDSVEFLILNSLWRCWSWELAETLADSPA